jgi:alkylation response protein AidB-like acyl-CoA dehydrogenase
MILNERQSMIRDTARQFAQQHLKLKSAAWDRDKTFPREALMEIGIGSIGCRFGFKSLRWTAEVPLFMHSLDCR